MRTLKKSLALVLALVMVLGLGVVGASADNALDNYTDTGDIGDAYLEAVGVLTGLGIVDGMTDTTIEPDGTYTRAQAAKIVATMLLGVDAADSLKATTAPFEDVPTYHWASGYIAYCVEAGIIDGMTATTFEPEGTLTGFQWAKMLLSAVGFGVNGEFEGDSWSLNTATVGHQSGLFTGDLDGADHVALRREQAMLYAFNALTKLPQVTYSKENTNYLYGILGYFFADGTGHTLGDDTFDLTFVEGQIIDNEGMGASKTYIDNVADGRWDPDVVTVKADTGLDLMYHAVRAWYVDDKNHTGVYTYDLAETTNYDCATLSDGSKAATKNKATEYTIGDGTVYETALVDNTALDLGYSYVKFEYTLGTKGITSEVKDTTVITIGKNSPAVPNDNIKTDISEIAKYAQVIVLVADSPETGSKTYAYYVYAPTTTTGVITKIDNNGTITLRDGTEIAKSVLFTGDKLDDSNLGVNYTITLDTHGHYYKVDTNWNLVYYTGAYTRTSNSDYVGDVTYSAQVVDVRTGDDQLVEVAGTWRNWFGVVDRIVNMLPGYYWLGEPNLNGVYTLTSWAPDYDYTSNYAHDWVETFSNTTGVQDFNGVNVDEDVVYTASSVKFVIVSGRGTNLDVQTYDNVADLLENYNVVGSTTGSVTLRDMALTTTRTSVGNLDTTIVFCYNVEAVSRYVFIPRNVAASEWKSVQETTSGNLYYYDGAYINGEATTVYYDHRVDLTRGFYSVLTDDNGYTRLLPAADFEWHYEAENLILSGGSFAQRNENGRLIDFAEGAVVYDARQGVLDKELDAISDPSEFDDWQEPALQVAYTLNSAGEIDVCYVVDWNLGLIDFTIDEALTGYTFDGVDDTYVRAYEDGTVSIYSDALAALPVGTEVDFTYEVFGGVAKDTAQGTVNADGYVVLNVRQMVGYGTKATHVNITAAEYVVTISETNAYMEGYYKVNSGNANAIGAEGETITLTVGDKLAVCWKNKSVAEGTVATVNWTNQGVAASAELTASKSGSFWTEGFEPGNTVVLGAATADYTLTIADSDIQYISMGHAAASSVNSIKLAGWDVGKPLEVEVTHDDLQAKVDDGKGTYNLSLTFGGDEVVSEESASQALNNDDSFTFENIVPKTVTAGNVVSVSLTGSGWAAA